MKRYIALLRGINISGKNKIAMSDLKALFQKCGYADVKTYLNSGNVLFSSDEQDSIILAEKISGMIKEQFSLEIPVYVILQENLVQILNNSPEWWGTEDRDKYDNLIFVMPSVTPEIIAEKIGEPSRELEQISIYENVFFWTFDRVKYAKANWWKKTAAKGIGEFLTIRTANTLRKISEM